MPKETKRRRYSPRLASRCSPRAHGALPFLTHSTYASLEEDIADPFDSAGVALYSIEETMLRAVADAARTVVVEGQAQDSFVGVNRDGRRRVDVHVHRAERRGASEADESLRRAKGVIITWVQNVLVDLVYEASGVRLINEDREFVIAKVITGGTLPQHEDDVYHYDMPVNWRQHYEKTGVARDPCRMPLVVLIDVAHGTTMNDDASPLEGLVIETPHTRYAAARYDANVLVMNACRCLHRGGAHKPCGKQEWSHPRLLLEFYPRPPHSNDFLAPPESELVRLDKRESQS